MSETSNQKPDLDDNTNVRAEAAAVSRENHMFTEGSEPISLWVILGSAIIVLVAGGVLAGSGLFDYKNLVKEGYVRKGPPDSSGGGAKPKAAKAAYMRIGQKAYDACIGCHQPGGEGNATYPPLAGSEWVTNESLRPAMIILNGCKGPIDVAGKQYNLDMPPMGSGMDAKKLAGLLNYIRNSFGNKSESLITVQMAEDALATSKERNGGQMTAEELNAKFKRNLKGDPIDPATMVDPKTLEPVE